MFECRVLGSVEVYVDGRSVDVGPAKQRCVLAVLLVEANRTVSVDQLIDRVWADRPPLRVRSSLHSYLTRLRRSLSSVPVSITGRSGAYVLTIDEDAVDLHRFHHLTSQARAEVDDERALALAEQALALWRGEPFAGLDTPWLATVRAGVQRERIAVQLDRIDVALRCGQHSAILATLSTLASERPLDERVAGQLMLGLYRAGRQADALEVFQRTRRGLAEDLGVDPGPELRALHEQVLRGDPAVATPPVVTRQGGRNDLPGDVADFTGDFRSALVDELGVEPSAGLRAVHASLLRADLGGNLPAEVTSFVGRARELEELADRLSTARLVTLTGGGGVGKSRLALRGAHRFPGSAWLVELAGLQDPALLHHAIADVLSVPRHSTETPQAVLAKFLRDRQLLLVLDNCEHLVDACADLVAGLLRAAPGLRVLVTSRHALRIAGEHIIVVEPLDVAEESVELFHQRAAAVQHGFTGDDDLVARICARLEGIPLAIELAAVRTRLLGLTQILEGLEDRYQLLTGGRRGGPPHHQTLRTAIDLSYELCTPVERMLWARLSVFADSFDLEAVKAVCDPPAGSTHLDLVDELLVKSVLARVEQAGTVRFRMLDTIRQYGAEKLCESGDDGDAHLRHRDYFLQLAEQGDAEWFGPLQEAVFTRTRLEHANLREALDFCLSTPGEAQAGVHLAGALWFYWVGCGFLAEGRHWLDRALAADLSPTERRVKALGVNGYIATLQGDLAPAVAMLEECRAHAHDETSMAYAVHRLGCNALVRDDVEHAMALFEEAQTSYRTLREPNSNFVLASAELAIALTWQGELDRATTLCERMRMLCEERGERWSYAYVRYVLGLVSLTAGELDTATAHAAECLRIKHTFHDLLGIVLAVELVAWIDTAAGTFDRAAVLLGAAQSMWSSIGFPLFGSSHFTAPHQACVEQVRTALSDSAFDTAITRGKAFSVEQAVTLALDR